MSYKLHQTSLTGESYTRCHQIVIDNRMNAIPVISYHQELVFADQAGAVSKMPTTVCVSEFDPDAEIAVINPETGEETGDTVTQGELMTLIYSAYIAAVAPPATDDMEPEND